MGVLAIALGNTFILFCYTSLLLRYNPQSKMLVTRDVNEAVYTLCHHKNMFLPLTRGGTIYKLIVQLLKNIIQSPTNILSTPYVDCMTLRDSLV